MIPQFGLYDGCLMIIYLFVMYLTAILYVQKKRKENPIYRYFIPGFTIKIAGGIVYALYHVYIYKGGDTFVFYNATKDLVDYLSVNTPSSFGVYLGEFNPTVHDFSSSYSYILGGTDVFFVVKLTSLFYLLSGGSYFVITILFSAFSFLGLWYAFLTFCKLYPKLSKPFFVAIYCVPTMTLWSSGLLKDTVTIGAIGFSVYSFYMLFMERRNYLFHFVFILINSWVIFSLKPYLIYVLYPSFLIWGYLTFKNRIKSQLIKRAIVPVLFLVVFSMLTFVLISVSESAGKYKIENIERTLSGFQNWHSYLAEERDQSGYSLGEFDFSVWSMVSKIPAAINVTFFRPYLWEVRNVATLLGAIEGLIFFIITLIVVVRKRMRLLSYIVNNKEVIFLLSFALPFAFVVGISSYNFGALSRYKIPAELFYLFALVIVYYDTPSKIAK